MKTIRRIAAVMVAAVALMLTGGCGTVLPDAKKVDVNKGMEAYYNQPNTAPIMSAKGTNLTFTLTVSNATEFSLNTPVPCKSIIPRDPGILDSIGGLLGQVMPWLAGAWIGGKLADRPATVQPAVVEKQVLVPVEGATP